MDRNAPECTKCKSRGSVIPIVYGKPSNSDLEKSKNGQCKLSGNSSGEKWHCKSCNVNFN